jgi:hypothetical protein
VKLNKGDTSVQLQFDGTDTAAITPRNDFDPVPLECTPVN